MSSGFQVSGFRFQVSGFKSAICYLLSAICYITIVTFSQKTFSQETIPPLGARGLKIGLALSGGGAKGFAHIGVLKVLEQYGVKVDYIAGTSMGAVVGGLYASGYNATQIDSIFKDTDFDELVQDYIPRNSKSFYEKRNDEMYAFSLPFKKFNLSVPVALSKGMYNYNLLAKLFHKQRHIRDFSKLPIPFLCIATDIEKGEQVILNKGYLPNALLASSAFPSLFSPVVLEGKYLIDGGVTNNFAVDEVKNMGADIVIGVDVQDNLKDRSELVEATRILVQISNIGISKGMKDKIEKTDIYIKPEVTNFSVLSFNRGQEIIEIGKEAALKIVDLLKPYGAKEDFKMNFIPQKKDSLKINLLKINDLEKYSRAYVNGKLGFKQSQKISYQDLKNGINKLNATQNFKTILFELNPKDGGDELNLMLTEAKDKTFVKFGLHFNPLYKSAILLNLTQKKSLFKNDVTSLDIGLGDNFRYNLDYYIDNGFYFSFGLKSRYNQFSRNVNADLINDPNVIALNLTTLNADYQDFTNQAYFQTIFAQKFLISGGIEYKHLKISSKTLSTTYSTFENSDYGSIFGTIKFDSYDNKYFPKKGWAFNGELQSYLISSNFNNNFEPFSIAKADAGIAQTFYKKLTLKLNSEFGFSFGSKNVPYFNFLLGGYGFNSVNNIKPFYGYDYLSLTGNSYFKVGSTIDYEIVKKNHLNFSVNFANIQDNLFDATNWIKTPRKSGYAVGYGLETIVGPIELKYSWSPELPKGFTWLSLGFPF